MGIIACKNNIFVLETEHTHYVLGVDRFGTNRHIHWGKKCDVNDYETEELDGEAAPNTRLDECAQEYTVFGKTMYRGAAFLAANGTRFYKKRIPLRFAGLDAATHYKLTVGGKTYEKSGAYLCNVGIPMQIRGVDYNEIIRIEAVK